MADRQSAVLMVMTGPPGSGKTTLSRRLAKELGLVLIGKDDLKLIFYESLGWGGRDHDREIGSAALEVMFYVADLELSAGRSLMLESNFRTGIESRFRDVIEGTGATITQIRCVADRKTLIDRLRARAGTRHPGYCDEEWLEELEYLLSSGGPLHLPGELIEVDTTTEVNYESLRSHLAAYATGSLPETGYGP